MQQVTTRCPVLRPERERGDGGLGMGDTQVHAVQARHVQEAGRLGGPPSLPELCSISHPGLTAQPGPGSEPPQQTCIPHLVTLRARVCQP